MKTTLKFLLLILLLSIGSITIFYHLERPFDSDSPAARVFFSSQSIKSLIIDPPDYRHPSLFYIALHYSLKKFGGSEFSAYLPGALLGIASPAE